MKDMRQLHGYRLYYSESELTVERQLELLQNNVGLLIKRLTNSKKKLAKNQLAIDMIDQCIDDIECITGINITIEKEQENDKKV